MEKEDIISPFPLTNVIAVSLISSVVNVMISNMSIYQTKNQFNVFMGPNMKTKLTLNGTNSGLLIIQA